MKDLRNCGNCGDCRPGEEQKPDWHVDKIEDNKVFAVVLKKINNRPATRAGQGETL